VEARPSPSLGRLDGVIEHAQRIALQVPDTELVDNGLQLIRGGAALLLEGMPDEDEQRRLKRYEEVRLKEVMARVTYVDQGRFLPEDGTEFDADFGTASEELLAFYSSSFFGHKRRESVRRCAAMRILEVTDEKFIRSQDVAEANKLKDMFKDLTQAELEENLEAIINHQGEAE
jgi:hypothetical protein